MRLILAILLMPLLSLGQTKHFTLTPEGFINDQDNEKDYVVIEFPGKSKGDLFKGVQLFINRSYVSPKNVISQVEGEAITVNGRAENAVKRNGFHVFDMDYTITFEFKDGRMKVSAPSFRLTTFVNKRQTLHLVSAGSLDGSDLGIYNSKKQLRSEMAKNSLEQFFNNYISLLKAAIENKTKEDW